MLANEDDNKLVLVKTLLNHVYDILKLFGPLMERMIELDEANKYKMNGTFENAAFLFGEISNICKKLEESPLPSNTFLENFGN